MIHVSLLHVSCVQANVVQTQNCHIKLQHKTISHVKTGWNHEAVYVLFHTFPLYYYTISKLSVLFLLLACPERGRECLFWPSVPWSLGLLFSPAPLLFYPACGAFSYCCCPPALCSCSSEEPLQAASRSLSQSPAGREMVINVSTYREGYS